MAKNNPGPGPEVKVDMKGAGVMGGEHSLGGAVQHLKREHPQAYDDRGPHQGTKEHIVHIPLHGLKPNPSAK